MANVEQITTQFKPVKMVQSVETPQVEQPPTEFKPVRKLSGASGTWESEKSFFQEMVEDYKHNWPRYLGATIGSIVGIPGGVPGMVAGATLGGAAGEGYKTVYQELIGAEEAPQTSLEAAKRVGIAGLKEGATELAGGLIMKPVFKVLAPFKKTVTEEGKIAFETLNKYMPKVSWKRPISRLMGKKVPAVLPAEMTEHRGLDLIHNIAEKSVLGSYSMARYKDVIRKKAIENMLDDLADQFGHVANPDELGDLVATIAKGNWEYYKDAFTSPLYNKVKQMTAPVIKKVPVTKEIETGVLDTFGNPIKKKVTEIVEKPVGGVKISLKEAKKVVSGAREVAKHLKGFGSESAGDNLVKLLDDLPDKAPYEVAQELRSRLLDKAREISIVNKKAKAIGLAKKLAGMVDKATSEALQKNNPEAYEIWRKANRLYKRGKQIYDNRFIRRLIRYADPDFGGEPERVLKVMFKNEGISGIRRVRKAIGDNAFNKLKAWYVRDLFEKSTRPGEIIPQGKMLINRLKKMGDPTLHEIFSPSELKALRNVAIALKVAQSKQAGGQGSMLIQLMQGGALAALATGKFERVGWGVLLTPEILARISLNPMTAKWLTEGFMAPKISASTLLRITNAADKVQRQLIKEKEFKKKEIERWQKGK